MRSQTTSPFSNIYKYFTSSLLTVTLSRQVYTSIISTPITNNNAVNNNNNNNNNRLSPRNSSSLQILTLGTEPEPGSLSNTRVVNSAAKAWTWLETATNPRWLMCLCVCVCVCLSVRRSVCLSVRVQDAAMHVSRYAQVCIMSLRPSTPAVILS